MIKDDYSIELLLTKWNSVSMDFSSPINVIFTPLLLPSNLVMYAYELWKPSPPSTKYDYMVWQNKYILLWKRSARSYCWYFMYIVSICSHETHILSVLAKMIQVNTDFQIMTQWFRFMWYPFIISVFISLALWYKLNIQTLMWIIFKIKCLYFLSVFLPLEISRKTFMSN